MIRDPRPAATKLRCPKCGSRSFALSEHNDASTEWDVVNGCLDLSEGENEPGNITGYFGECRGCLHLWKMRGTFSTIVHEQDGAAIRALAGERE